VSMRQGGNRCLNDCRKDDAAKRSDDWEGA
jgi:hypothetical protein